MKQPTPLVIAKLHLFLRQPRHQRLMLLRGLRMDTLLWRPTHNFQAQALRQPIKISLGTGYESSLPASLVIVSLLIPSLEGWDQIRIKHLVPASSSEYWLSFDKTDMQDYAGSGIRAISAATPKPAESGRIPTGPGSPSLTELPMKYSILPATKPGGFDDEVLSGPYPRESIETSTPKNNSPYCGQTRNTL